ELLRVLRRRGGHHQGERLGGVAAEAVVGPDREGIRAGTAGGGGAGQGAGAVAVVGEGHAGRQGAGLGQRRGREAGGAEGEAAGAAHREGGGAGAGDGRGRRGLHRRVLGKYGRVQRRTGRREFGRGRGDVVADGKGNSQGCSEARVAADVCRHRQVLVRLV